MSYIDHEELPFKFRVTWLANCIVIDLVMKETGEEYSISIWHTTAYQVRVDKRTWKTVVEKRLEEKRKEEEEDEDDG